jgi:circadian clock protein KaiC
VVSTISPLAQGRYGFPRFDRTRRSSGIPELDALLGGGIEQGSSTLLIGPAGTGKSTFVPQFIASAVKRGEKAALFVFDEELGLLFDRTRDMGFDLEDMRRSFNIRQFRRTPSR